MESVSLQNIILADVLAPKESAGGTVYDLILEENNRLFLNTPMTTSDTDYTGEVVIGGNNSNDVALNIIGTQGTYHHGGKIVFGDVWDGGASIDEWIDDGLRFKGSSGALFDMSDNILFENGLSVSLTNFTHLLIDYKDKDNTTNNPSSALRIL